MVAVGLVVKGKATVCDGKKGLTAIHHRYLALGPVGVDTRARSEREAGVWREEVVRSGGVVLCAAIFSQTWRCNHL